MRFVEHYLKSPESHVPPEHRNNLRFYVGMHAVAGIGSQPYPKQIESFDTAGLNNTVLKNSLDFVQSKYLELGGNDQVAKGTTLLQALLDSDPLT